LAKKPQTSAKRDAGGNGQTSASASRPPAAARESCHYCGAHLRPENNFCPQCGMPADPVQDQPLFVVEGLTSLFNVVFFESLLETELNRATRYGRDLSVLVAEIDSLPELEAAYGYDDSNRLIREVGEIIATAIREPDTVAATNRVAALGTQRFLILLPETSEEGAFRAAEKIRALVAATVFRFKDGPGALSLSLGAASTANRAGQEANLLGRATQALIESRHVGHNRTQVHTDV
jgi:diguanylate cyclase (GGDEF)-like protein